MSFKLALNAGHSLTTAGKRCLKALDHNETKEYVLNKRICDKIQQKLSLYSGIEILRIDDGTEITLKNRTNKANAFGADFYLAIHHNAGINGGIGGGIEAYVYLKVDNTTLDWQKDLYEALIKETGLKGNRATPLKSANFAEVRDTKMPAVLLELGFMDSKTDVPIILTEDYADKCAKACVDVIVAKAKLTKKVVEPPKPTVAPPMPNSKYYPKCEQPTNSFVDALKSLNINSTFNHRKKIAKKNGIAFYYGWSSQNIKLLNLLKQGKLIKP